MAYRLRFIGGEQDGEIYPVDEARGAILGRSPTNTVYIRDKNVSRVHCQIAITDEGCVITDLQSTNGTYVNGERITERTILPGDEVKTGLTVFRLEQYDPAEGESGTTELLDE